MNGDPAGGSNADFDEEKEADFSNEIDATKPPSEAGSRPFSSAPPPAASNGMRSEKRREAQAVDRLSAHTGKQQKESAAELLLKQDLAPTSMQPKHKSGSALVALWMMVRALLVLPFRIIGFLFRIIRKAFRG